MNKHSMEARAFRTFVLAAAGGLVTASGYIVLSNFHAAYDALVVTFFSAVGATILSVLGYIANIRPVTPVARGGVTAAQYFIATVPTLALTQASLGAVQGWGVTLLRACVAAIVTGVIAYVQNGIENKPA